MRRATSPAPGLPARAYAWLLWAYPPSFRTEFGDEMVVVFSDCCRDTWRSEGPLGICRLIGRTALDTLASAPPLWAEGLEETMKRHPVVRGMGLWLADHGLVVAGLALLALSPSPLALSLGCGALALAFFAWVAETEGFALPRPGRVAIRTCGCCETPLAFVVRRGKRALFFVLEEDPEEGGWSGSYSVRDRANGTAFEPCFELPLGPGSEWRLRGRVPAADLRFEHHERVSYVIRASLERSLAAAGV